MKKCRLENLHHKRADTEVRPYKCPAYRGGIRTATMERHTPFVPPSLRDLIVEVTISIVHGALRPHLP
jgi:hypothetical protein